MAGSTPPVAATAGLAFGIGLGAGLAAEPGDLGTQ